MFQYLFVGAVRKFASAIEVRKRTLLIEALMFPDL